MYVLGLFIWLVEKASLTHFILQILYDSPNDLTSTYYASAESADTSGPPKTYRLPDRDAGIFEIIFRYLNREQVLPLRKSACPVYLSYEQTLQKLAEEAKFYRFTKLQRALPAPLSGAGDSVATLAAPQYASQVPVQPHGISTPTSSRSSLQPVPLPSARAPTPHATQKLLTPLSALSPLPATALQLTAHSAHTHEHHRSRSHSHSTSHSHAITPATPVVSSPRPPSRSHSRTPSVTELPPAKAEPVAQPQSIFAYIYRPGQFGVRRGDQEFQLVDYPDDIPLPHLFMRIINAEIK